MMQTLPMSGGPLQGPVERMLELRRQGEPLGIDFHWVSGAPGNTLKGNEVVVSSVAPGGPYARAGLPAGVAITQLGGVFISTAHDLRRAIAQCRGLDRVPIVVAPTDAKLEPPPQQTPQAGPQTTPALLTAPVLPGLPADASFVSTVLPPPSDPDDETDGFEKIVPQPQPAQRRDNVAELLDPRELAALILDAFDADGDDVLSYEEFNAFLSAVSAEQVHIGPDFMQRFPHGYGAAGLVQDLLAAPDADRRHIANVCLSRLRTHGDAAGGRGPPYLVPEQATRWPAAPCSAAAPASSGAGLVAVAAGAMTEGPTLLSHTPARGGPLPTCWGGPAARDDGPTVVVDLANGSTKELRQALVRLGRALEGRLAVTEQKQRRIADAFAELEREAHARFGCGMDALLVAAPRRADISDWATERMHRIRREALPGLMPPHRNR